MKIARVKRAGFEPEIGIVDGDTLFLTAAKSALELFRAGEPLRTGERLPWSALENGTLPGVRLLAPVNPPEVWACGFTYERGPQFARSPAIPKGPAYTAAIEADRPEIFFKTTGFRVVGPGEGIGIRGDARYTAVEPELCLILDEKAEPGLVTIGNDVSAWDIEAMNPLWLAQGKTFEACCALGPAAVTLDELPPDAEISCRVSRRGEELFFGSITIDKMRWSLVELAHFAAAYNPLPAGTVLMTGTAIVRPDAESLAEGDVVEIAITGIGTLRNTGRKLISAVPTIPYYK